MEKKSAYYKALRGSDALFMHETNDCSVRAFAVAADTTYRKSHALHAFCGRVDRKGTLWTVSDKVAAMLGMEPVKVQRQTLQTFITMNPKGSFWVARSGHAFAVVNGIVYDWQHGTGPRSRVIKVFKLKGE